MSRFKHVKENTNTSAPMPQNGTGPVYGSPQPYQNPMGGMPMGNPGGYPNGSMNMEYNIPVQSPEEQQRLMQMQSQWPQVFPKAIVGLDRDGVINVDRGDYIKNPSQWEPIPGSLEAIRMIRLKGYKLSILTNQGGIQKGVLTHNDVNNVNQHMMQAFGQAGIFSIDGLFYSESSLKDDYYAKPNIGMFERAEAEIYRASGARFKNGGFYVGDKMSDIKAAYKAGATPILVRTGHGEETEKELKKFSAEKYRKKTKIFDNLLEFAESLK